MSASAIDTSTVKLVLSADMLKRLYPTRETLQGEWSQDAAGGRSVDRSGANSEAIKNRGTKGVDS
jgi:hypothetical protein